MMLQRETIRSLRGEIEPLWVRHHAEIARDGARVPLAPDWPRYLDLENMGKLVVVTARRDGALVGYALAIVDSHLHYAGTVMGFFDIYWLDPALRGTGAGIGPRLLAAVESVGTAMGAEKWFIGSKVWQDHSRLFERMGWAETERLYSKHSKV